MRIVIDTIPHHAQKYNTCGDWRFNDRGHLVIRVSKLGDWKMEACVAVHELVEVLLCTHREITTAEVDEFDKAYEKKRKKNDDSEPGDDPKAPYRKEHFFATSIERLLAAELGIDWKEYEEIINALP